MIICQGGRASSQSRRGPPGTQSGIYLPFFQVARLPIPANLSAMPVELRYQEFINTFKTEMQQCVTAGFRAGDCFPFLMQNLAEDAGISLADRPALQQELLEWTRKII